jgi:hypothetical protein
MKKIPLLTFQIHSSDLHFEPSNLQVAFSEVLSLNGNGIRTDISWSDIEPEKGKLDSEKVEWYQHYLEEADKHGLATICNLYGMPGWAKALYRKNTDEFFERWSIYCQKVDTILGDSIEVVQVWNEHNNPLYSLVSYATIPTLINLARDRLNRKRKIAVNVLVEMPLWETYTNYLLKKAQASIDIIGIDHYPGTYSLSRAKSWKPLKTLLNRVNDPGDLWYGKVPAILETGFSTYIPAIKNFSRLQKWIQDSFSAIGRINERYQNSLYILNWYKLFNDRDEGFLNVLGHFGILRMLREDHKVIRKQPAYDALAKSLSLLNTP